MDATSTTAPQQNPERDSETYMTIDMDADSSHNDSDSGAQSDGDEDTASDDGRLDESKATKPKSARDDCSDKVTETQSVSMGVFAQDIANKLFAAGPEALKSFVSTLKSCIEQAGTILDPKDADIEKRLTDLESDSPLILIQSQAPPQRSTDSQMPQQTKPGTTGSLMQPQESSNVGKAMMSTVHGLMEDRIMKTAEVAASSMAIYEQRIKTAVDSLHAIETWFRVITEKAGDMQELGLTQRFTMLAIKSNSMRLADTCLLY